MHPILFKIGSFPIYSYGVTMALAFIVGTVLAVILGSREGVDSEQIIDLALYILIGGIIFARLIYALANEPDTFLEAPLNLFKPQRISGLSFFGALLGGVLGGIIYTLISKLSFWKLADITAPCIALGLAIGRIGCFLNGCCYGYPTEVAWGVTFPPNTSAGLSQSPLHPTQLYASFGALIILGILLFARKYKKYDGFLFLLFGIIYSIMRFIVEIYRDNPRIFYSLTLAQIVCIATALGCFGLLKLFGMRYRSRLVISGLRL